MKRSFFGNMMSVAMAAAMLCTVGCSSDKEDSKKDEQAAANGIPSVTVDNLIANDNPTEQDAIDNMVKEYAQMAALMGNVKDEAKLKEAIANSAKKCFAEMGSEKKDVVKYLCNADVVAETNAKLKTYMTNNAILKTIPENLRDVRFGTYRSTSPLEKAGELESTKDGKLQEKVEGVPADYEAADKADINLAAKNIAFDIIFLKGAYTLKNGKASFDKLVEAVTKDLEKNEKKDLVIEAYCNKDFLQAQKKFATVRAETEAVMKTLKEPESLSGNSQKAWGKAKNSIESALEKPSDFYEPTRR